MLACIVVSGWDSMGMELEAGFERIHCCMPQMVQCIRVVGADMTVPVALSPIPELELELELDFDAAIFHVPAVHSSPRSSKASSHSGSKRQHRSQVEVAEEPFECNLGSVSLESLDS